MILWRRFGDNGGIFLKNKSRTQQVARYSYPTSCSYIQIGNGNHIIWKANDYSSDTCMVYIAQVPDLIGMPWLNLLITQ